ncbi:hypothetical protein HDV06_003519 [Boothiomyces sp. JEL0866]|nr:hypothetical protein HDV06_003487 [Boothiomyces sp. JEL0866]KAJ3325749.1 hypothetical protein HDV06_003519 [Boothiomyces sp. JEL0866]
MITWGSIKRTLTNEKDYETCIDKATTNKKFRGLFVEKAWKLLGISNPENNAEIITALMERLKKPSDIQSRNLAYLFDYMIQSSLDFQKSFVNYPDFEKLYESLPLSIGKILLLQFMNEWSLKYNDSPIGPKLKNIVFACVPGMEAYLDNYIVLPTKNMSLEDQAQRVEEHTRITNATIELYEETLNSNSDHLRENDLARYLHEQCARLKKANDMWIAALNPGNDIGMDALLRTNEKLKFIFNKFKAVKESEDLKTAKQQYRRAKQNYRDLMGRVNILDENADNQEGKSIFSDENSTNLTEARSDRPSEVFQNHGYSNLIDLE